MKRFWSFFLVSLALGVAPGPDILFVLAQSLASGWQAGVFVTLGLCSGLVFHVSLAAFGIAAVLSHYPRVFKAITWVGAAYLVYLGVLTWQEASVVQVDSSGAVETLSSGRLYLRGVIMNILNPKVMLFFLALVPRFIVPTRGAVAGQFVVLGLIFAVSTLLVFTTVSVLGGSLSVWLAETPNAMPALRYFSALVMFGIAAWIGWMNSRK